MNKTIILIPTSIEARIGTTALNLQNGIKQINNTSTPPIKVDVLPMVDVSEIDRLLRDGKRNDFLEEIVKRCEDCSNYNENIVIVPGIQLNRHYAAELNLAMATALDANIIFVFSATVENDQDTAISCEIIANSYFEISKDKIIGCFIDGTTTEIQKVLDFTQKKSIRILGENITDDSSAIINHITNATPQKMTPALFRYRLIEQARKANKTIVLPEGNELRTIQAANICAERGIAQCVLLGDAITIKENATKLGINLSPKIRIIDAQKEVDRYINPLVELRRGKGLTPDLAKQQLQDSVVMGTMMLKLGEVDGLVSGATHTTANTIRPALQLIKTKPDTSLVSSIFFMCLPEQVSVYGDCAVKENPTAEELADIAIQSADSAKMFGITPRIAMLSYSTMNSAQGPDVDKVRLATELVRSKRPDLLIDGPLQYDAATIPEIAAAKAPNSALAGKTTVFVFPNLSAGNIAYKAVQRSTKTVSIGPILQGLRQPVNDLSRGCAVEDIVLAIAITAVQAKYVE